MVEPENYRYWLSESAKACIPKLHDWRGVGYEVFSALRLLWNAVCITLFRTFLLLTFPVSVPVLAFVLTRLNKRAIERHNEARKQLLEAMTCMSQAQDTPKTTTKED